MRENTRWSLVLLLIFAPVGAAYPQTQQKPATPLERLISLGADPRISRKIPIAGQKAVLPAPAISEPRAPDRPRTIYLRTRIATIYPNIPLHPDPSLTQSELSVASNPFNPDVILAGSNAVRSPGGFGSQGWYYTTNGGSQWSGGDTLPTHADLSNYRADPSVAIDLDENIFFSSISLGYISNLAVARARKGGVGWSEALVPDRSNNVDKDAIAVDLNSGSAFENTIYAGYTDFALYRSPVKISRSTDGGQNFGAPVPISDTVGSYFSQGIAMAVGPNSELYAAWSGYDAWPPPVTTRLGFNKSTDGGSHWRGGSSIRPVNDMRGFLYKGSDSIRVSSFPSMAVDRTAGVRNGWIYIAFGEQTVSGPDIFLIRSSDGGDSWSAPKKVNQDSTGRDHWLPWITVDQATGVLYVVYYDSRNFPGNDSANVYLSSSADGGDTFEDVRVSDVPFHPGPIPGLAAGYMGDYIGITAAHGIVRPCWNDNRNGIQQAYSARMVFSSAPSPPTISVSPDSLDYGDVFVGYQASMHLAVRNISFPESLRVTDIRSDSSIFTPSISSFALAAGGAKRVDVDLYSGTPGLKRSILTVSSNDSSHPAVTKILRANVVYPPSVSVTPDSLALTLHLGDSAAVPFAIHNTGLGPAKFALESYSYGDTQAAVQYTIPLRLVDSMGSDRTISFGVHPRATYGIDPALGEYEAPPPPPPFAFEARFLDIPGRSEIGGGLYLDLRSSIGPAKIDTYHVHIQAFDLYPVTLSWPADLAKDVGSMRLIDVNGGSEVNVDMLTSTSTVVADPHISDLFIISDRSNSWLGFAPDSGSVAAGADLDDFAVVRNTLSHGGEFFSNIGLKTNDPVLPWIRIPFRLRLIGVPKVALDRDSLDFGNTFVGLSDTLILRISDHGTDSLHIRSIYSEDAAFTALGPSSFSLFINRYRDVGVRFTPAHEGPYAGVLHIVCDDPSDSIIAVPLHGNGTRRPIIQLATDSVFIQARQSDSSVGLLRISNSGLGSLSYRIENNPDPLRVGDTLLAQSGAYTLRGNVYSVDYPVTLREYETFADLSGPLELQFLVYESGNQNGPFHQILRKTIASAGPGKGFYSSGAINQPLSRGKFYCLATAFHGPVQVRSRGAALPLKTSFGRIFSAIIYNSYPPPDTMNPFVILTSGLWCQTVHAGPTASVILSPDTGSLAPGEKNNVAVAFHANLPVGLYHMSLLIASNDPGRPVVSVPLELAVMLPNFLVQAGWNMLALRVKAGDSRREMVLPGAVSPAFSYDSGYTKHDTLRGGIGYWVKFPADQRIDLAGAAIGADTIEVRRNWNLIGSISFPAPVNSVFPLPRVHINSPFLGYSDLRGYFAADTLQPGAAYWVRTDGPGRIVVSANATMPAAAARRASDGAIAGLYKPENAREQGFSTLDFRDPEGRTRTLYFAGGQASGDLTGLELPPAPAEVFDVRFQSDRLAEHAEAGSGKASLFPIAIRAPRFPLMISWDVLESERDASLEIITRGSARKTLPLRAKGLTVIEGADIPDLTLLLTPRPAVPREFALHQNFPNPFNPATTTQFDLPRMARVTLKIYNLLGEEAKVLLDNALYEAGSYFQRFDASDLPSGVYFCRMSARAGSGDDYAFRSVIKMMVLR
ncbi:MAG: choice-of-anchor D domain-containing protein [Ignavibacteria bacterium]|nr:MAG: choice-of-anchor D domain-containing protein [Ignavibacteria bacterium]